MLSSSEVECTGCTSPRCGSALRRGRSSDARTVFLRLSDHTNIDYCTPLAVRPLLALALAPPTDPEFRRIPALPPAFFLLFLLITFIHQLRAGQPLSQALFNRSPPTRYTPPRQVFLGSSHYLEIGVDKDGEEEEVGQSRDGGTIKNWWEGPETREEYEEAIRAAKEQDEDGEGVSLLPSSARSNSAPTPAPKTAYGPPPTAYDPPLTTYDPAPFSNLAQPPFTPSLHLPPLHSVNFPIPVPRPTSAQSTTASLEPILSLERPEPGSQEARPELGARKESIAVVEGGKLPFPGELNEIEGVGSGLVDEVERAGSGKWFAGRG